jgi:hypothetical protein
MDCPECCESLKSKWHFCPNCGHRVSKVGPADRAHILESMVRLAQEHANDWEHVCKTLYEFVGITPEEVQKALAKKQREGWGATMPDSRIFNLNDKDIDNIFAARFRAEKEKDKRSTPRFRSYGEGVRSQVFEVIVRQAIAGAPWREICAGPMEVNGIRPEEIEEEVARRQKEPNQSSSNANVNPRAGWGFASQYRFRQLQTRVEQALSKPLDLNETLVQILRKDLEIRKLILNTIVHDLLSGGDWNEALDRWVSVYEISAREIEEEIRRRVRGDEDGGPAQERVPRKPLPFKGDTNLVLALPRVKQRLVGLRDKLAKLMGTEDVDADMALKRAIDQVDILIGNVLGKLPKPTDEMPTQTANPDSTDNTNKATNDDQASDSA